MRISEVNQLFVSAIVILNHCSSVMPSPLLLMLYLGNAFTITPNLRSAPSSGSLRYHSSLYYSRWILPRCGMVLA